MRMFHLYNDIVVALMIVTATAGLLGTVQALNEPSRIGPFMAMSLMPFSLRHGAAGPHEGKVVLHGA